MRRVKRAVFFVMGMALCSTAIPVHRASDLSALPSYWNNEAALPDANIPSGVQMAAPIGNVRPSFGGANQPHESSPSPSDFHGRAPTSPEAATPRANAVDESSSPKEAGSSSPDGTSSSSYESNAEGGETSSESDSSTESSGGTHSSSFFQLNSWRIAKAAGVVLQKDSDIAIANAAHATKQQRVCDTTRPAGQSTMAAGSHHTCAITESDGYGVHCFGSNDAGQLDVPAAASSNQMSLSSYGNYTCSLSLRGEVTCWGRFDGDTAPTAAMLTNKVAVAVGSQTICTLAADGTVSCWGRCAAGCAPTSVAESKFEYVSSGDFGACGISDGVVTCWGDEQMPHLTDEAMFAQSRRLRAMLGVQRAGGTGGGDSVRPFMCALSSVGGVQCSSVPSKQAATVRVRAPVEVESGQLWLAVSYGHACSVSFRGRVTCWGDDRDAQATVPDTLPRDNIVEVDVGRRHTCALSVNGTVICWGAGMRGKPDDTHFTDVALPCIHPVFLSLMASTMAMPVTHVKAPPAGLTGGTNEVGALASGCLCTVVLAFTAVALGKRLCDCPKPRREDKKSELLRSALSSGKFSSEYLAGMFQADLAVSKEINIAPSEMQKLSSVSWQTYGSNCSPEASVGSFGVTVLSAASTSAASAPRIDKADLIWSEWDADEFRDRGIASVRNVGSKCRVTLRAHADEVSVVTFLLGLPKLKQAGLKESDLQFEVSETFRV